MVFGRLRESIERKFDARFARLILDQGKQRAPKEIDQLQRQAYALGWLFEISRRIAQGEDSAGKLRRHRARRVWGLAAALSKASVKRDQDLLPHAQGLQDANHSSMRPPRVH